MAYLSDQDRKYLQDLPENTKKLPLRKLIDLMCQDCSYDNLDVGTWRQQVERCTATGCPLYKARPRRIKQTKGAHNEN